MANDSCEVKTFPGRTLVSNTRGHPSSQREPMKGFAITLRPRQPAAGVCAAFRRLSPHRRPLRHRGLDARPSSRQDGALARGAGGEDGGVAHHLLPRHRRRLLRCEPPTTSLRFVVASRESGTARRASTADLKSTMTQEQHPDSQSTPFPGPDSKRSWIALVFLCLGQFMFTVDDTVVNVALPSIERSLGFDQSGSSGRSTSTPSVWGLRPHRVDDDPRATDGCPCDAVPMSSPSRA